MVLPAWLEWLRTLDHVLFFALNATAAWPPLAWLAAGVSHAGQVVFSLLAVVVLARDGWPAFRVRGLAFLLIAPLALGANHGLKEWMERARPLKKFEHELIRREVVIRSGERLWRNSFPSGHTTVAFFALGYLAWLRRRHAAWALALAALMAWSRVAMGSHFPLDCLAGAILGLFWSWAAWRISRIGERLWMRQETTASPGLSSGRSSAF